MAKIELTIIIVNYHVGDALKKCLKSIYDLTDKINFEVIVVDNDERKKLRNGLIKDFPKVIYIPNKNLGFAQANNVAARVAKGSYLFFLNPDTIVFEKSIKELISYLDNHKRTAITAPVLLDRNSKPYPLQGFSELSPQKALFSLSFINKLLPKNPISKKYWLTDENKESIREVSVVPGSAFVIRNDIFLKLGGFDENFFLYFEEHDLCKRVKELGYSIVVLPTAKVFHAWGLSTSKSSINLKSVYDQSLFYYFRKHYGRLWAYAVSGFLKINSYTVLILAGIAGLLFFRLFRISSGMTFIGDQGWFYLSARDMLISGNIPLLGITSSHTWIHQGPLWTYMLSVPLVLTGFNPVSGAYFSAFLDVLALLLIYKLGKDFLSKRVGIVTALIYATSPIVVENARMPYHTSPIPLFVVLLIYSLLKWVLEKEIKYFPVVLFSLAVLYNLELASAVFWPCLITILIIGIFSRADWITKLSNRKTIALSFLSLFLPMVPMLVHDFSYGFFQTLGFAGWLLVYKPAQLVGLFPKTEVTTSFQDMVGFFVNFYSRLIFKADMFASTIFLFASTFAALRFVIKNKLSAQGIIFFTTAISVLGLFASRTPSEAYLPMLFPGLILIFAFGIDKLLGKYQALFVFLILTIVLTNSLLNVNSISRRNDFSERKNAVREILKIAGGREYNLIGSGPGSNFESFTMNYEYLTWWMGGNPPVKLERQLKILVNENITPVKVQIINEK